jgi:hypothetical protein
MTVPQISFETLNSQGGKPKDYYLVEFFRLYEKYWDDMSRSGGNSGNIDLATGLLIGCCPHKPTREKLWKDYQDIRNKDGALTASILISGDLWDYLSNTMEFTEDAYAGG